MIIIVSHIKGIIFLYGWIAHLFIFDGPTHDFRDSNSTSSCQILVQLKNLAGESCDYKLWYFKSLDNSFSNCCYPTDISIPSFLELAFAPLLSDASDPRLVR